MGLAKSEVILVSPTSPTFEDWMQPPVLKEHPETAIPEFGESGQFKCVAGKSLSRHSPCENSPCFYISVSLEYFLCI